jgi:transcriptional regulator with XRE-family HTH domain
MSRSTFAKRVRIDPAMIGRIERGENSNPSFATMAKIAKALDVSLDTFRSDRSTRSAIGDAGRIQLEEEIKEATRLSERLHHRLSRLLR